MYLPVSFEGLCGRDDVTFNVRLFRAFAAATGKARSLVDGRVSVEVEDECSRNHLSSGL